MLPPPGDTRPTLVCLHFLGGSARTWQPVADRLAGVFDVLAVDLPGFGDAAGLPGYAVAAMADHVAAAVRARAPARWRLAGHSMGAKVAAVLARRAEDGELAGLDGLVLLGGSPPGPEPMDEGKRQAMMRWFAGTDRASRAQAAGYIADNAGTALPRALRKAAVADVLRCKRDAWLAWLARGSREDWADRVGVLHTPALLIVGSEDNDLGEAAQRRLTVPHLASHTLAVLPGAGHLLPLEQPGAVAALIAGPPAVPAAYRALIASGRVSTRTRQLLTDRAQPDDPAYQPACLSRTQLVCLRAVAEVVLPQPGPGRIDLAARMDAALAAGTGDGWRFDALPPDPAAWRAALDTLDGQAGTPFATLAPAKRQAVLTAVAHGVAVPGALTPAQMQLWFNDLRAEAVRVYVAHPATLAAMGYSGIGYGGDGPDKPGFTELGIGARERWEPVGQPMGEPVAA